MPVKVNLKQKILDHMDNEIKILDKTSIIVNGMNSFSVNPADITAAKPVRLGDALIDVFSRKITVKTFEDAAEMKKWHSKFHNKFITGKGIIELDSDELKEIKSILDTKADPTKLEVMIDGEVYRIVTDYLQLSLTKK